MDQTLPVSEEALVEISYWLWKYMKPDNKPAFIATINEWSDWLFEPKRPGSSDVLAHLSRYLGYHFTWFKQANPIIAETFGTNDVQMQFKHLGEHFYAIGAGGTLRHSMDADGQNDQMSFDVFFPMIFFAPRFMGNGLLMEYIRGDARFNDMGFVDLKQNHREWFPGVVVTQSTKIIL